MRLEAFQNWLSQFSSVAVAFSGGVDSSVLLAAAVRAVGAENVVALTVVAETVPEVERQEAARVAQTLGVKHQFVTASPMGNPEFLRNDRLRCYYCKRVLFGELLKVTQALGVAVLLEGSNADDARAYRPGAQAIAELGVPSPLRDFEFTKQEIRALAAEWGLSVATKPSTPCLATRLEYGLPVTVELLRKVEMAEQCVREVLGGEGHAFRVRVHANGLARLELDDALRQALMADAGKQAELNQRLRELGFRHVTLDLAGFRSGSWDV